MPDASGQDPCLYTARGCTQGVSRCSLGAFAAAPGLAEVQSVAIN